MSVRITWSHRNTPGHQCTALVGHFPGQVTGCLVDLGSLDKKTRSFPSHEATEIILILYFFGLATFCTHSDVCDIATYFQLVLAAVERERLEHIGSCSQELPVQLPH